MSLLIKNIDTVNVVLDDLGITLVPLEQYDLTQERAFAVATSADLLTAIDDGLIQVLDPLDDVTPLTPKAVAQEAVTVMNDTHFRIRGGRAIDVAFDNGGTDNDGTDLQVAVVNNSGKVKWQNLWADQQYEKHDMVIDGDWTMIANTQTTDRAAPQAIGDPDVTPVPSTTFATASDTSIIKMVHRYTMTESGWINVIKVRVPNWDLDSVTRVTLVNVTTGESKVIENPILGDDVWVTVVNVNTFITASDVFEVWFEFYNSSAAGSIDGGWTSDIATGTPALANFKIDNVTVPTTINIDHTDLDTDNRSTELDGVVAGSIITMVETGDPTRNIEVEVVSVDTGPAGYTGYTVSLVQLGSKVLRDGRTCTVHIDVPITQPSQYSVNTDYYLGVTNQPSFGTVVTRLYYDGVQQADINDAYGIQVTFQEALISPDWDVVAVSQNGLAGAEGAGGEANTASNLGGGDGVFAQKNLVDLEFKSITTGAGISVTPSSTELLITNTSPNIVQDIWYTLNGDTGSATPNSSNDTLTVNGTADQITTAVVGSPEALLLALADNTVIPGNEAIGIPTGTTGERPGTPATGDMRFNTTTGFYEAWNGTEWVTFGSEAGSGVKEITGGQLVHLQGTTQIPYDDTPPLVTEGTEFFTHDITTATDGARIVLWFSSIVSVSNANRIATISLFRDTTLIGVTAIQMPSTNAPVTATFIVVDTPGTAGTYTYSGRIGVSAAATWRIGGFTANANYGGAANTNNQYVLMRVE